MINNLEGLIWTHNGLLVFSLSEKSDDDFEIISCGLGTKQGFAIEDSITSKRWEKTWFVNTVDGLLYQISWETYHKIVEDSDEDKGVSEGMNLVTCSSKYEIKPINIHYMMNFVLNP